MNPKPSIGIQLVVTNKTNTYWTEAKYDLQRTINDYDIEPNDLKFGMAHPMVCLMSFPMSCSWEFGKYFESDKFTKADDTPNTVTFTNPNNYSIAPGETVTFNYAIADWGEGGFYLKQSYTGYSGQAKSVPEPTSIFSLLALGTVGFASIQKRKQQMT
ncbi:MAG TPA: PEP-CTERM sorting domain-containing protein [Leptolyngbyaceae cyanobacterium]